ncbi:MAG: hypothetical protein ACRD2D_07175, partial [Terriglobales bacterium]
MRRVWRRLAFLLRRDTVAEEMQFHLNMLRADGRPAMRFGNEWSLRERSRAVWGWMWMRQLGQDWRQLARRTRRHPALALAAVTILGLGIGANAALFSVVDAVLLQPLPFPQARQLVTVANVNGFEAATVQPLREKLAAWLGRPSAAFVGLAVFQPATVNAASATNGAPP